MFFAGLFPLLDVINPACPPLLAASCSEKGSREDAIQRGNGSALFSDGWLGEEVLANLGCGSGYTVKKRSFVLRQPSSPLDTAWFWGRTCGWCCGWERSCLLRPLEHPWGNKAWWRAPEPFWVFSRPLPPVLVEGPHLSVLPYDKKICFLYIPPTGMSLVTWRVFICLLAPGSSFPRFLPAAYITSDAETDSDNVLVSK